MVYSSTNYGCVNTDRAIIISDGTVAVSQTLTAGMLVTLNTSGQWIVCPTSWDASTIVGVIMEDVTTDASTTQADIRVCIFGLCNVKTDASIEEGIRLMPSDANAGQVEAYSGTTYTKSIGFVLTGGGSNAQATIFLTP